MKPIIKLMPDYDCWPLWGVSDVGNIDPHTLPLSPEIIERLIRWADMFDSTLNRDDPASSFWPSEYAYEVFKEEGYQLWLALRQELASIYTVWYKDVGGLFQDPSEHSRHNSK